MSVEYDTILDHLQKASLYELNASDYTILDADGYTEIWVTTGGADRTITLPTLADNLARHIKIVNIDGGDSVIIDGEGAETINGKTTFTITIQYGWAIVTAGSNEWLLISNIKSNVYDTGWVNCSDWTDQHLGDAVGGNVNHALDAPISDLLIKVLISTDGTDANSFEPITMSIDNASPTGMIIYDVDDDNIKIQTATGGLRIIQDDGSQILLDTENWYYKIKVYKL